MLKQYKLRFYNFRLILWLLALSTIGVLLVGSARESLQNRQLFGVLFGFAVMIVVSLIDFSWILNFSWILYAGNLVLLLAVWILGDSTNGATRWINLGFVTFQPTELSKIILIVFFAKYFLDNEETLNTPKTIIKSIFLLLVPLALIYIQPDMKNTITVIILFCVMIYTAGLSYKVIGGAMLVVIPLLIIFLSIVVQPDQNLIQDYQRTRIMSFLYPEDEEYADNIEQQQNSILAIGSGQLTGKGLENNDVASVNNGNFVSENQTDFIFAVAGEELGFIGCCGIILLLFLIAWECIRMSLRSKDLGGRVICCGAAALVMFQSFVNICVATGMMPNTGTPLPFVSYGLSSLVSLYIGMGLVLNVGLQSSAYRELHKSVWKERLL